MSEIEEHVRQAYEQAVAEGKTDADGALVISGADGLVVVPSITLWGLQHQIRDLQRQLDEQKTEESIAWFRQNGIDDSDLLSPEDSDLANIERWSVALRAANQTLDITEAVGNLKEFKIFARRPRRFAGGPVEVPGALRSRTARASTLRLRRKPAPRES